MWQEAFPWSPAAQAVRPKFTSSPAGWANAGTCLRRPAPPCRSCSPRTRATAAGQDSCWRSSAPTSRCCGCRTAWRSSKAGGSIRRGLPTQNLIHVEARDARDALWAMEEGVRCAGLSAVIGEIWGDPRALDFTATRRLAVASERSASPCWLVRLGGTANLSGARMRWRIASAPSLANALDPRAPGTPAWDAELFRARGIRRAAGASRMKRVLSIWLPQLAIERWAKSERLSRLTRRSSSPSGHARAGHPCRHQGRGRARRAGRRAADRCAGARSGAGRGSGRSGGRCGAGERLARWAGRWSPLVEVDGDGLRLDVSGVAHLFGGEHGLVRICRRRFARHGLTVRVAIAPTAAAAWALARFTLPLRDLRASEGGALSARAKGDGHCAARPLPVSALRLDADTVRTLERLGLKTIGALLDMPRLALARRFRGAEDVVDALDRALGRKPEPLTAVPPIRRRARCSGWKSRRHIRKRPSQALERLIPDLVRQLQERHLGARRLALHGFRVDGSVATASVATAIPSREPKHLQRLLADKAAALDPEFGFDAFALTADWTEDLAPRRKAWSKSRRASARWRGWSTG